MLPNSDFCTIITNSIRNELDNRSESQNLDIEDKITTLITAKPELTQLLDDAFLEQRGLLATHLQNNMDKTVLPSIIKSTQERLTTQLTLLIKDIMIPPLVNSTISKILHTLQPIIDYIDDTTAEITTMELAVTAILAGVDKISERTISLEGQLKHHEHTLHDHKMVFAEHKVTA